MICLAPSSGKTEHSTESSDSSSQSSSKGLSNSVLHFSLAALVLKLRMLKLPVCKGII